MKAIKEIIKYLLLAITVGWVASWTIAHANLGTGIFDKGEFMSALVTFSTGAMVSIFLAIFHSSNEKLSMLREKYHAKTLYLLVIIFNGFIVLLSGFANSNRVVFGVGVDSLSVTISIALGVLLTWFVARIISLYFTKTR